MNLHEAGQVAAVINESFIPVAPVTPKGIHHVEANSGSGGPWPVAGVEGAPTIRSRLGRNRSDSAAQHLLPVPEMEIQRNGIHALS